jgi:ABC-type sugar transport system permease subunit
MAEDHKDNEEELPGTTDVSLSSLSALADNSVKPDPWYKRLGNGILELLVKLVLLIVGIVLDLLKALWALVKGIFVSIYKFFKRLVLTARKIYRIWNDVDIYGKLSFFFSGTGQIAYGQVADGIVYLVLEVAVVVWMATTGWQTIGLLSLKEPIVKSSQSLPVLNIIEGSFAVIALIAYFIVYVRSVQGMYDDYQIRNLYEFKTARKDSLYVLDHLNEFEKELPFLFQRRNERMQKRHNRQLRFCDLSPLRIRHLMRHEFGYNLLSARYIAQIPFKRLLVKRDNKVESWWKDLNAKVYARYDKVRTRIKLSSWSSAFGRFLEWEPKKAPATRGFDAVRLEIDSDLMKLTHSYDKYNNYHSYVRDHKELVRVLADPDEIIAAVTAEDRVSKANNVVPLGDTYTFTDKKGRTITKKNQFDAKHILSREIGAFEMPFAIAKQVSELYVLAKKLSAKSPVSNASLYRRDGRLNPKALQGKSVREILLAYHDFYEKELNEFVTKCLDGRLSSVHGYRAAYDNYVQLRPFFDQGKSAFKSALRNVYSLSSRDAEKVYRDYAMDIKDSQDDEKMVKNQLMKRGLRLDTYVAYHESLPFHGQPERFKHKVKSYADERFAVTILSLPTLGAIITCIIPLIFSILTAFTSWDPDHKAGDWSWDVTVWKNLGGFFTGNAGPGSYAYTFLYLLQWTIVWAILATFSNYILGILLALLINKKGIKLKKMWRTIFVVTIAIPQFITLLSLSILLSKDGAVNATLIKWGWIKTALNFLDYAPGQDIYQMSIYNKITVIVVNMWIGIPYTMLSTSGILMNIPEDLYESSRIDGAGPFRQLTSITMPYILFVTGPSLLTTFIGNINNFNVIFFLTGGGANISGQLASKAGGTDLLITWLYKLATGDSNNKWPALASAIGIIVFVICIFFSLMVYDRLGSVKNEEEFQ